MNSDRARIDQSFSLYLDLVRFVAALLVVGAHLRQWGLVTGWPAAWIPSAGREAVVVFFVLSGFVIAFSTRAKTVSIGDYFMARLARIYSVALPALCLSFLAAAVLRQLGQEVGSSYQLEKAYQYVPLHMLFAGEFWTLAETPPLLSPYWSLSHEVWYYILFGVVFYLRGLVRAALVGALLLLTGHKLWLLFPVWGAGVFLFHWLERNTIPRAVARAGWLASVLLLAAYNLAGLEEVLRAVARAAWPFAGLPLGSGERVLGDYLVCGLVLLNFACARYAGFGGLQRLAAPIRTLAFHTFSLYLAHALVLGIWRALGRGQAGNPAGSPATVLLVLAAIAGATWALARLAEFLRLRWLARFAAWQAGRTGRAGAPRERIDLPFSGGIGPGPGPDQARLGDGA